MLSVPRFKQSVASNFGALHVYIQCSAMQGSCSTSAVKKCVEQAGLEVYGKRVQSSASMEAGRRKSMTEHDRVRLGDCSRVQFCKMNGN